MAEYVLKEDILKYLEKKSSIEISTNSVIGKDISRAIDVLYCDIENMSAADVQPVKHGRWLSHHAIWIDQPKIEGWFVQAKCSECEKWAHVMNPYTKSLDYERCPHCGARMDGDTE